MKTLSEYINENLRERMKHEPDKQKIMNNIADDYIRSIKIKGLSLKDYPLGWRIEFESSASNNLSHMIISLSKELIDKNQSLKIYNDIIKIFDKEIICLDQFDFRESADWFELDYKIL